MKHLVFAHPQFFFLLLGLIPWLLWYRRQERQARGIAISSIEPLSRIPLHLSNIAVRQLPLALRTLILILFTLALARPQLVSSEGKRSTEGLDVVLVIDTSGSMRALDFELNGKRRSRLDVVKAVITEFIQARADDRIGIVVFGSEAFTQAPLTLDHQVLEALLKNVEIGVAGEETAIGDSLGVATKRLKDLKAKSKVIILLTDGDSNAGKLDPRAATEAAKTLGVKIYSIGVGSNGPVPYPMPNGWIQQAQFKFDEELMQHIASTTGGQYFRATDTEALKEVYRTIDKLEKTKSEVTIYSQRDEVFTWALWPAVLVMLVELMCQRTRWWRIP